MELSKYLLALIGLIFLSLCLTTVNSQDSLELEEDEEDRASKENEPEKKEALDENNITEEIFNKLNVFRLRSEEEIGYVLEMIDLTLLQVYYVPHSQASQKAALELYKLNDKIEHLAGILLINCEEFEPKTFKHCQKNSYSIDSFPKIRLFIPPDKRYNHKTNEIKRHYDIPYTESEITVDKLFDFVVANIPNKAIKVDDFNINSFLNTDTMNKVILFTNEDKPGLIFRGLSNNLYDELLFGWVHSSEKELIERFKIKQFPSLMIYKNIDKEELLEEPIIKFYVGNTKNVNAVKDFLKEYALPEKKYISMKRGIPEESGEDIARNIEFREVNKDNYLAYFKKYNENNRVMILFNTKNKLKVSVKKYLVEAHGYYFTIFFNCKNEKEFCLSKFGVKSYPSLQLYDIGSFNTTSAIIDKTPFLFNPSTNSTFLEDFNTYVDGKSTVKVTNDVSYPFAVNEAKEKRKFILISAENENEQKGQMNQLVSFKLLSTLPEYNKHFDFLIYMNPPYTAVQDLEITRYPYMVIKYHEVDKWTLVPVNPNILFYSLKSLADNFIHYRFNKKLIKTFENGKIKQLISNSDLRYTCNPENICVLAFVNAVEDDKNKNLVNFHNILDRLEILSNKDEYKDWAFGWLNTTCTEDLVEKFNFDTENGGLIIYQQWRGEYGRFPLPIDDFMLTNFFDKTLSGGFPQSQLDIKDLTFNEDKCKMKENFEKKTEEEKKREKENKGKRVKTDL